MSDIYTSYTKENSFEKNGFILIPNILDKNTINSIRSIINDKISVSKKEKKMLVFSDIFGNDDLLDFLTEVQFNKKIVTTLNQIFNNDFYYVNDLQIQCNMFGIKTGGWHTDSNSEVSLQSGMYLHSPSYSFGKVGVYLQDNTVDFGGAIDVIPKSHKIYKYFKGNKFLQYFYARLAAKVLRCRDGVGKLTVPIKAGDAVFFDSRLMHRSSPPHSIKSKMSELEMSAGRVPYSKIKPENAKYALYWEVGDKDNSLRFLRNSCKRAMEEEILCMDNEKEPYYTDYLRYSYPSDYLDKYKKNVNKFPKLNIASLDADKSKLFKSLF